MELTHDDAVRLHAEQPGQLARIALDTREEFAFEPRDMRAEPAPRWGGELRVCLNQNVVLHFVPAFNQAMEELDELPQFAVMPSDEHASEDLVHRFEAHGDLDAFDGVVFWVEPQLYRDMVDELSEVATSFPGRCLLPDILYHGSRFVHFVSERVLRHRIVRDERRYDFSKVSF